MSRKKKTFRSVEENDAIFIVLCKLGGVKQLRVDIAVRRRKLHSKNEHTKMKRENDEVLC
jgi:hypothetical protein